MNVLIRAQNLVTLIADGTGLGKRGTKQNNKNNQKPRQKSHKSLLVKDDNQVTNLKADTIDVKVGVRSLIKTF